MLKPVLTKEQMAIARERAQRSIETARAAAELAVSADNARRSEGVGRVRGSADVVLKYRNVKSKAGLQVSAPEERVVSVAGDVFTASSLVVSAIALPRFAQRAATSFRELKTMIHDNNYNTDQRLAKLEELARSSAGTVFSAQGVVVGGAGTLQILRRRPNWAPRIDAIQQSGAARVLGAPVWRVLRFLLPVADFAVLTGEMIATRRVFSDPTTTARQRTRKVVDISLATLKMSLWMLPGLPILRTAYNWASMGQLGLIMLDYRDMLWPHFLRTLQGALWAVTHPAEAVGQALLWTTQTIGKAVQFVAGAIGAVIQTIIHPVATWNTVYAELSAWYRAYIIGTGQRFGIWTAPSPPVSAPATVAGPTSQAPAATVPVADPLFTPPQSSLPGMPLTEPTLPPPLPDVSLSDPLLAPVAPAPELPAPDAVLAPIVPAPDAVLAPPLPAMPASDPVVAPALTLAPAASDPTAVPAAPATDAGTVLASPEQTLLPVYGVTASSPQFQIPDTQATVAPNSGF